MISDSGYDPDLAGGRGGYVLGSFQGGPDPNSGRDAIAQAVLAQQGMQAPQSQGMNDARGPDQGAPYRQAIGNQGWSLAGNDVFDPGGNIVGRQGLQQYGFIPGVTPQQRTAAQGVQFNYPYGSSLSGGMAPGTGGNAMATSNASMDFADPSMQGFESGTLTDPSAQGPVTGPGALGFHGGGGMLDVFDPSYETPASPPTGQVPDPEDPGFVSGTREASLSDPSGMGGFGGGGFGGAGTGGGSFDPGGNPGGVG